MKKAAMLCAALAVWVAPVANADPIGDVTGVVTGVTTTAVNDVDTSCKQAYQSGDQCQAPDGDSSDSGCSIASWVGSASCDLSVAGGQLSSLSVSWGTRSDQGSEPSYDITLADKATGAVLYHDRGSGGADGGLPGWPVGTIVPLWQTNWSSNTNDTLAAPVATTEVVCTITGTHASAGAVFPDAHNTFACSVS